MFPSLSIKVFDAKVLVVCFLIEKDLIWTSIKNANCTSIARFRRFRTNNSLRWNSQFSHGMFVCLWADYGLCVIVFWFKFNLLSVLYLMFSLISDFNCTFYTWLTKKGIISIWIHCSSKSMNVDQESAGILVFLVFVHGSR